MKYVSITLALIVAITAINMIQSSFSKVNAAFEQVQK